MKIVIANSSNAECNIAIEPWGILETIPHNEKIDINYSNNRREDTDCDVEIDLEPQGNIFVVMLADNIEVTGKQFHHSYTSNNK